MINLFFYDFHFHLIPYHCSWYLIYICTVYVQNILYGTCLATKFISSMNDSHLIKSLQLPGSIRAKTAKQHYICYVTTESRVTLWPLLISNSHQKRNCHFHRQESNNVWSIPAQISNSDFLKPTSISLITVFSSSVMYTYLTRWLCCSQNTYHLLRFDFRKDIP